MFDKPINYTTEISHKKTIKEILVLLNDFDCQNITVNENQISFEMLKPERALVDIPVNYLGLLARLKKSNIPPKYKTETQAKNIIFRTLKNYIINQFEMLQNEAMQKQSAFFIHKIQAADNQTIEEKFIQLKNSNLLQ
ncbi:MAG: hypothetical protein MUE85_19235 [Microscillaceae bacterium]|nr:hypothetical protein [Microscillaceae bacterium]